MGECSIPGPLDEAMDFSFVVALPLVEHSDKGEGEEG